MAIRSGECQQNRLGARSPDSAAACPHPLGLVDEAHVADHRDVRSRHVTVAQEAVPPLRVAALGVAERQQSVDPEVLAEDVAMGLGPIVLEELAPGDLMGVRGNRENVLVLDRVGPIARVEQIDRGKEAARRAQLEQIGEAPTLDAQATACRPLLQVGARRVLAALLLTVKAEQEHQVEVSFTFCTVSTSIITREKLRSGTMTNGRPLGCSGASSSGFAGVFRYVATASSALRP